MNEGKSAAKPVTLREANQSFTKLVRAVEAGEEFVITRRGVPVARLAPVSRTRVLTRAQEAALERTRRRLEAGWDIGGWPGRAAIYDERADELDRRRKAE